MLKAIPIIISIIAIMTILIMLILAGCTSQPDAMNNVPPRFTNIGTMQLLNNWTCDVLKDNKTGFIYMMDRNFGLTPLLGADGEPTKISP